MRDRGLNRDRHIEINRAHTWLGLRTWVISLPNHHEVTTALMTHRGTWLPGRLTGEHPCFCEPRCRRGHPVPWRPLGGVALPATVTHDYRYSAGSQPVSDGLGRTVLNGNDTERLDWFATAWCIACDWSRTDTDEHSVRAAARSHRADPNQHPTHDRPRRHAAI